MDFDSLRAKLSEFENTARDSLCEVFSADDSESAFQHAAAASDAAKKAPALIQSGEFLFEQGKMTADQLELLQNSFRACSAAAKEAQRAAEMVTGQKKLESPRVLNPPKSFTQKIDASPPSINEEEIIRQEKEAKRQATEEKRIQKEKMEREAAEEKRRKEDALKKREEGEEREKEREALAKKHAADLQIQKKRDEEASKREKREREEREERQRREKLEAEEAEKRRKKEEALAVEKEAAAKRMAEMLEAKKIDEIKKKAQREEAARLLREKEALARAESDAKIIAKNELEAKFRREEAEKKEKERKRISKFLSRVQVLENENISQMKRIFEISQKIKNDAELAAKAAAQSEANCKTHLAEQQKYSVAKVVEKAHLSLLHAANLVENMTQKISDFQSEMNVQVENAEILVEKSRGEIEAEIASVGEGEQILSVRNKHEENLKFLISTKSKIEFFSDEITAIGNSNLKIFENTKSLRDQSLKLFSIFKEEEKLKLSENEKIRLSVQELINIFSKNVADANSACKAVMGAEMSAKEAAKNAARATTLGKIIEENEIAINSVKTAEESFAIVSASGALSRELYTQIQLKLKLIQIDPSTLKKIHTELELISRVADIAWRSLRSAQKYAASVQKFVAKKEKYDLNLVETHNRQAEEALRLSESAVEVLRELEAAAKVSWAARQASVQCSESYDLKKCLSEADTAIKTAGVAEKCLKKIKSIHLTLLSIAAETRDTASEEARTQIEKAILSISNIARESEGHLLSAQRYSQEARGEAEEAIRASNARAKALEHDRISGVKPEPRRGEKSIGGAGMRVEFQKERGHIVVAILPGYSADKSRQINLGDLILQVNGLNVRDLPSIKSIVSGEAGTECVLLIQRGEGEGGEKHTVSLRRTPLIDV